MRVETPPRSQNVTGNECAFRKIQQQPSTKVALRTSAPLSAIIRGVGLNEEFKLLKQ